MLKTKIVIYKMEYKKYKISHWCLIYIGVGVKILGCLSTNCSDGEHLQIFHISLENLCEDRIHHTDLHPFFYISFQLLS